MQPSPLSVFVARGLTKTYHRRKRCHLQTFGEAQRSVEAAAFTKVSALGVEEQRVNVVIDLTSPTEKWQSLGDGYKVYASIIVARLDNAIKVPVSALFRDGEQWTVFTIASGKAARRIVQLGRRGALEAVVENGLQPGEKIIVHPGDSVRDGRRIKPTPGV